MFDEKFIAAKKQPLYTSFVCYYNDRHAMLRVNESAASILYLCDGSRTIDDMVAILTSKYREDKDKVATYVNNFITSMTKLGHVKMSHTPQHSKCLNIVGSDAYWTPDTIAVELTKNCPLKCRHCYLNAGVGENISLELINKLTVEARNFYLENVQLTGGEPLIHPNFFEILDASCTLNATIHVFTSGYIVNSSIIEKLKNYSSKNIILQVSVDGLEEYHDSFRGVKGCFNKTLEFIKEMVSSGFKIVVGICIDTQTYEEIKELCCLLKSIGVSAIRIGAITNQGRAENVLATSASKMQIIRNLQVQLSNEEDSESFNVIFAEEALRRLESEYGNNCGMGQTIVKISPTGMVSPCLLSEIVVGDINGKSLVDIQKEYSRKFEKLRAPNHRFCAECSKEIICESCINEGLTNKKHVHYCSWYNSQSDILSELA